MLFTPRPDVTQLPVKTVVGQGQQRLGLAIRVVREECRVLAAKMHVAKKADAGRVALQFLLGGHWPGSSVGRDLEFVVADNLVANPLLDRLPGEPKSDRNLVGLVLSGRHVMDLKHQPHALWKHHCHT